MKKSCLLPFYSYLPVFVIKVDALRKSIVSRKVKIKEFILVVMTRLKII